MSNTSNSNTNNNLYNICSLEHCYTNLFALTDITGIKWLRLRAKEKTVAQATSNSNQTKKQSTRIDDEDEEDDDDEDEDECDEETNKTESESKQTTKSTTTNCLNDPILLTHAKCLNEDILCSWKRLEPQAPTINSNNNSKQKEPDANELFQESILDESSFKKELWIFWYEKEEPPNLRSLLSNDLIADQNVNSQSNQNNPSQHTDENILSMASSSLNSLPYECRSMLFKALHNLIEKSLLEKGYARLGKWFVQPYNLNAINYSIYSSNSLLNHHKSILLDSNQPTVPIQTQSAPSPVQASRSGSKLANFTSQTTLNTQQTPIDESNHVSYSFSFFLHGASRVCTSVDIKLHKPIRNLNTHDLISLRENLKTYLLHSSTKSKRKRYLGQNVILGPYGISARLIGYLSNESTESKLTCEEWKQFYPLKLVSNLPNVFVVGLNKNKLKLFYPNCFIYIVIDSESDKSDDDDLNHVNLTDNELESSLDEEEDVNLSSSNETSQSDEDESDSNLETRKGEHLDSNLSKNKNKEMDSLDLTIDSVARNFGNEKPEPSPLNQNNNNNNKSYLSASLNSPLSVTAISSPSSVVQSPSPQSSRRASLASNSRSTNKTNLKVEPLAPPLALAKIKKRKKNLDSSSSDLSLNSSLKKQENNTPKKKVCLNVNQSKNSNNNNNSKISPEQKIFAKPKKESCQKKKSLLAKVKKLKSIQFLNVNSVLNEQTSQTSTQSNDCCKYKFNLNKNLTNQLRLKHKKYDLLVENLPLAFDILDKSGFSACNNFVCTQASSTFSCARCSYLDQSQKPASNSTKCTCTSIKSPKALNTLSSKDLGSSLAQTVNSLGQIKTEPNSLNLLPNTSKLTQQAFHKRKCYFNHVKPNRSFKKYKQFISKFRTNSTTVCLSKTLQFNGRNSNSKVSKIVRIRNDRIQSKSEEEEEEENSDEDDEDESLESCSAHSSSEYSIKSNEDFEYEESDEYLDEEEDLFDSDSSTSSYETVKTDPDLFNYQYFEKEPNDSLLDTEAKAKFSASSSVSSSLSSSESSSESSSSSDESSDNDEEINKKSANTLNRTCFTNLTNKSLLSTINVAEVKFKKLIEYNQENENSNDVPEDMDNNSESEKSFDIFYDFNNQEVPANVSQELDCEISTNNDSNVQLISSMAKSSQMTPPKSVESFQTPHTHHHHHSNAASILPVSYDDLNNIFEEESSTDEQQSSQSQQINHQAVIQPQQQQQQQQQANLMQNQQHINTIQTSLSVVMTPPSHENVLKPNQINQSSQALTDDDLISLNCLNDNETNVTSEVKIESTKNILFNDLNTILNDPKRKPLLDNSFEIPKLANNVSINKYKPFSQFHFNPIQSKLKWKLSSQVSNKKSKNSDAKTFAQKTSPQQQQQHQQAKKEVSLLDENPTNAKKSLANLLPKQDVRVKPFDQFYTQIDQNRFKKVNLNLNKYLNSVCLSLNLSDTLLNAYRDINFDSCTLCVCANNIKGLDFTTNICLDIFNTNESNLNINNNHLHSQSSSHSSQQQYTSCSCGFSSIVNRNVTSRTARAIRLKKLIKIVEKLKLDAQDQNLLVPYYNLISLLNRLTQSEFQSKQLVLMDSANYNGLFIEDYVDILMLTQPHYLFYNILQENSKFILSSSLITRKFLNSILLRDNYQWKNNLTFKKLKTKQQKPVGKQLNNNLNLTDEKLQKKQNNEFESVQHGLNVLDIFDQKYSTPMLSTHETYDLFYLNGQQFDLNEELDIYNMFDLNSAKMTTKLKRYLTQNLNLNSLNRYDENNVCLNVIKRLSSSDDEPVESKFLLHNWLYSKREIKSNLELTKSLKLIQPLLEETVQKKYTTSRMWESFQGPLTWQHFCRLAFRDSGGSQQNRHHNHHNSHSNGSGSSDQSQSKQANSQVQNNHSCYEPEPIPALLVSSVDKDWVTISPYAIKFWDKLNLEPYSRAKNIAYIIMMPEFGAVSEKEIESECTEYETIKQSVKEYFKELNSIYELCKLGLHRPALRIAPEQGFVRVPLDTSKQKLNVKVDPWFTKIQTNKETRQLGKYLKVYAKTFRSLAAKITQGNTSTISNTVEASFFPSETLNNRVKNTTSFQTAAQTIPTVSAINLDRTIYEELKQTSQPAVPTPPNQITPTALTSTPSLSNLLNQPIGNELLLNQNDFNHHHSPLDFSTVNSTQSSQSQGLQPQAQILNFTSSTDMDNKESVFMDSASQQYQQQQQTLNNIAAGSNLTQISQLTANTSPPSLFVYIIDPFDYHLYNTLLEKKKKVKTEKEEDNNNSDINDEDDEEETEETTEEEKITEFDLRRLRTLGLFKAYLEFYNNVPDLFKYSTQFQIIPLNLCVDLQQQSTSMYIQSMMMHKKLNSSNYSSYYSSGFGTSWSDLDMDFKQSLLKNQAFNVFSLSKRYFMSPAHNFYLNLHQQQINSLRPKTLTCFGPAAYEERFLHETLLQPAGNKPTTFSTLKKLQFYSPLFILAPSTITSSAVSLAASNLFFKNSEFHSNKTANQNNNANGAGECISSMAHFIQLNMSNSNYGFLNNNNNYNFNLNDVIQQQQQQLLNGSNSSSLINSSGSGLSGSMNGGSAPSSGSAQMGQSGSTGAGGSCANANSNFLTCQPHQQQCNVLYVGYCLSEDQRYLLACCSDENGELIESTSIYIEVDERFRRKDNHVRRVGLRKLWEFIVAVISQTCKPWRLVIGRLGRVGHSELRGWACLLSKKNLQRVCQQLKENCDACNILGNLEAPLILSACLISMETCDTISVYPESYSREDKVAAAALTGQQQLLSSHAAQAHGVSCTHILTFPCSAVIQTQSSSMGSSGMKDLDPLSKAGAMPMEDDLFNFLTLEEEEMNDFLNDNMNDKALNESGAANEVDHVSVSEKIEILLNQEELVHLDQQPLAVGYYVSTAKCGPLPKWLRGDVSMDSNFHTFKATLHIHNRYALENDELIMKTENSHKLDSSVTYEVLRYVLERYNALSWLNIDPLMQDRKSCLPIHHSILLQMYFAFKNYI